jgi:hypothetical protein
MMHNVQHACEDWSLLGYDVLLIGKMLQTSQRSLLVPFSGSKQSKPVVTLYQLLWHHIEENLRIFTSTVLWDFDSVIKYTKNKHTK